MNFFLVRGKMVQKPKFLSFFTLSGQFMGQFCPTKHLKLAEHVSLAVLQRPTKFQVKILIG